MHINPVHVYSEVSLSKTFNPNKCIEKRNEIMSFYMYLLRNKSYQVPKKNIL